MKMSSREIIKDFIFNMGYVKIKCARTERRTHSYTVSPCVSITITIIKFYKSCYIVGLIMGRWVRGVIIYVLYYYVYTFFHRKIYVIQFVTFFFNLEFFGEEPALSEKIILFHKVTIYIIEMKHDSSLTVECLIFFSLAVLL